MKIFGHLPLRLQSIKTMSFNRHLDPDDDEVYVFDNDDPTDIELSDFPM